MLKTRMFPQNLALLSIEFTIVGRSIAPTRSNVSRTLITCADSLPVALQLARHRSDRPSSSSVLLSSLELSDTTIYEPEIRALLVDFERLVAREYPVWVRDRARVVRRALRYAVP